jgi:hypothetical protein
VLCWVALACSKKPAPLDETFEEPREANPAVETRAKGYELASESRAHFLLKGKDGMVEGTLPISGTVLIDLVHLDATTGTLSADLLALRVKDPDEERSEGGTTAAHHWLELTEPTRTDDRTRFRHARFTLTRVTDSTSETAHAGRRPRKAGKDAPQPTNARAEREIHFIARGDLELHGYRADYGVSMRAIFQYAEEDPTSLSTPTRVRVMTRRPLYLPFDNHDVKPRDPTGTVPAEALARDLGHRIQIDLDLVLVSSP